MTTLQVLTLTPTKRRLLASTAHSNYAHTRPYCHPHNSRPVDRNSFLLTMPILAIWSPVLSALAALRLQLSTPRPCPHPDKQTAGEPASRRASESVSQRASQPAIETYRQACRQVSSLQLWQHRRCHSGPACGPLLPDTVARHRGYSGGCMRT